MEYSESGKVINLFSWITTKHNKDELKLNRVLIKRN